MKTKTFRPLFEKSADGGSTMSAGRLLDQQVDDRSHPMDFAEFEVLSPTCREPLRPDLRYTEEDLTKAVDDARHAVAREVEAAMREELANDADRHRRDLLAAIKDQITQQRPIFEGEIIRLANDSYSLAKELAMAIIPRAIEKYPLNDIADSIAETLHRLSAEPSIELRLPPDLADIGAPLFAELAKEAGVAGAITITADPSLDQGEAELRWRGGLIDRRIDRLQSEALEMVDSWLERAVSTTDGDASGADWSEPTPSAVAPLHDMNGRKAIGGYSDEH